MGYDVHITSAERWFEARGSSFAIPREEWRSYVERDTEFNFHDHRRELAVWTVYSRHDPHSMMAGFLWAGGVITVKYRDNEIMRKMLQVANALGGRAQGDELEIYFERNGALYQSDGLTEQSFNWVRE